MEDWKLTGKWAPEEGGECNGCWDMSTGAPTLAHFGSALQVWAALQERESVTVNDAALAFNVPPQRIREAVAEHPWMFLEGEDSDPQQSIGHDGE